MMKPTVAELFWSGVLLAYLFWEMGAGRIAVGS